MVSPPSQRYQILNKAVAIFLWLSIATVVCGAEIGYWHRYNRSQAIQQRSAAYMSRHQNYIPNMETEVQDYYQSSISRKNLDPNFDYYPLCQTKREKVTLRNDEYDYHPPHYYGVLCSGTSGVASVDGLSNQCAPGFLCNQAMSTLYVSRRRWLSDCWEPHTIEVPSNCECLWPKSKFED